MYVGTQKNCLNETVLLSTLKHMFKLMAKKIIKFYANKISLSGSMYKLHAKETQKCMRHAMIPKYILTPNLGFLPQIIYRYALGSTLLELKPEVKVTLTWNQLVTRQGPRCIYIPNVELLP